MKFVTKYAEINNAEVMFARYVNGKLAMNIVDTDTLESIRPSVNVDSSFGDDFILVKDYSENEGVFAELANHGVIEPVPVGYIPSGMVTIPVAMLTPEYRKIRDEQLH